MIMVITNIRNTNERNQLMVYKDLIKMQRSRLQILLVVMALSTGLLSSTTILHGNQQEVIAQKQAQRSSSPL
jgi:hypothetical protein